MLHMSCGLWSLRAHPPVGAGGVQAQLRDLAHLERQLDAELTNVSGVMDLEEAGLERRQAVFEIIRKRAERKLRDKFHECVPAPLLSAHICDVHLTTSSSFLVMNAKTYECSISKLPGPPRQSVDDVSVVDSAMLVLLSNSNDTALSSLSCLNVLPFFHSDLHPRYAVQCENQTLLMASVSAKGVHDYHSLSSCCC